MIPIYGRLTSLFRSAVINASAEMVDIQLPTTNAIIRTHKALILHFAGRLLVGKERGFLEATTDTIDIFADWYESTVRCFNAWLYTGAFRETTSDETADLYLFADYYCITAFKETVYTRIVTHFGCFGD